MKNLYFGMIATLLLVFGHAQFASASVFEVDQSYKPSPAFGNYIINDHDPVAQTFKPTKEILSSVFVVISSPSTGNYQFTLILKKSNTNISSSTVTESLTGSTKTISFDFSDLPKLTPNAEYALYLETSDTAAAWLYGQSGSAGEYVGGQGIIDGTKGGFDFHFVTYGPITESQQDTGPTDETPLEEDTNTISPPTNLESVETGSDYLQLSWDQVDDANVTGYKLYYGLKRSDLNQTIDVGDDTAYIVRGLDPDTKYYFTVTAYDETRNESLKSAVLEVTTDTDVIKTDPLDIVWYIARILVVLILVGIVGFWYWKKRKNNKKNPGPSPEPNDKADTPKPDGLEIVVNLEPKPDSPEDKPDAK